MLRGCVDIAADLAGLWLRLAYPARARWRRRILYHEARAIATRMRRAGKNFSLGEGVLIRHPGLLSVGDNVRLLDYCFLDCLSRDGVSLGNNVLLERNVWVRLTALAEDPGAGLEIGDGTSIGAFSVIGAGAGVRIGSNVMLGQRVNINSEMHRFEDPAVPIREQGAIREGIVVEDDCWIGSGAIVLDGVTVGRGSVVGAGSVVTRDLPPFSIAAGVPARVIGQRGDGAHQRVPT